MKPFKFIINRREDQSDLTILEYAFVPQSIWLCFIFLLFHFHSSSRQVPMGNKITVPCNIDNGSAPSSSSSTSESTSYANYDVTDPCNIDDASAASSSTPHNHDKAAAAASSSTSPSTSYSRYDVFINHRGPDVKATFATRLYHRLLSNGYQAFLDKPELEEGYPITCQIEAAIQVASLHIAIFSPTYAKSKWCLDELVLMVKSKTTILPVFFNVKPDVLPGTAGKGAYAEALLELQQKTTYDSDTGEKKPRYDSETLENWRNALSHVSLINGFELKEGEEDDLLDKVVQGVLKKLPKQMLDVAKYPTGLDEKLKEFETKVVSRAGVGNKVVGIVGTGGVGKTTLAKNFFNLRRSNYDESSFLFDVRQTTGTSVSVNALQRKLLMDLKHKDFEIENRDRGIKILQNQLEFCRVLIVLDDVDDATQLEAFLPISDSLTFDSLILVTSRDKHVLISSGVSESSIYNLSGLNEPFSKKLFCSYAFFQPDPPKEFADLVDQFITACHGLPLSLKVFGALVCGKSNRDYWEEQLDGLSQTLPTDIKSRPTDIDIESRPTDIESRLRISYESLTIENKPIFLDIACFFIGEDRNTVIRLFGLAGLQNLEDRCMLEVDTNRKIKMHDHIRDMGRNIAKERSVPPLPRRLFQMTNRIDDLSEQWSSVITEEVRGIRMVSSIDDFFQSPDRFSLKSMTTTVRESWYKRWTDEMSRHPINELQFHSTGKLQFIATRGHYLEGILKGVQSPDVRWLRWYRCPNFSLPSWIPMKNLRVLDVEGSSLKELWPDESPAPVQLRELNIWAPLSVFPRSIGQLKNLEKIVIYNDPDIDLERRARLETLPEEFCDLNSLKYLELKWCVYMRKLPDAFGKLSNLQYMILEGACSLTELPSSFGNLPRLKHLCFSCCRSLTISNGTLENISTLEYLDVSYEERLCPNVKQLPNCMGNLRKLEVLKLEINSLELLPPSFVSLNMLKDLSIRASPKLKRLPHSFELLSQLTELSLWQCGIEYLPQDLPKLNNLQILKVSGCPLRELPFPNVEGGRETQGGALNKLDHSNNNCMVGLKRLELDRTDISEIAFLQGFCPNLTTLDVRGCFKLKRVRGLGQLSKLLKLDIVFCHGIEELELGGIEHLVPLEELRVVRCEKLKSIKGLEQLTKLLKLAINECHEIEELKGVKDLISLEEFNTSTCKKLTSIPGLEHLKKLHILDVRQCRGMQKLPNMEHLVALKKLDVSGCCKLKSIQGLGQLTQFQMLNVAFCYEIRELPGVEHSKSLEELDARKCQKLQWGREAVELLHEQLKERFIL